MLSGILQGEFHLEETIVILVCEMWVVHRACSLHISHITLPNTMGFLFKDLSHPLKR